MSLLPFKRILAPVDFSDHANRALANAAELAAQFGAKLYALHVVAPVPIMDTVDIGDFGLGAPMGPMGGSLDVRAYQEQLVSGGRSSLEKLVKETVPAEVEGTAVVEVGDAASVIVEVAEREEIDCIVMATHGLTGLSHLLMGSVAEKVVRHAPVPVLIVRQDKRKS